MYTNKQSLTRVVLASVHVHTCVNQLLINLGRYTKKADEDSYTHS